MKMHCKKHSVTLLELLIAMSLAMVILSTLTFFFHQVNVINTEMDLEQNAHFQKRYAENRLAAILPRTLSAADPSHDFHFFTTPDLGGFFKPGTSSLVFSFDNCVQLDKTMTYHVIGRLYLDDDGNLILAKWPAEKRWKENEPPPLAKEILHTNVEDLVFRFFVPPDKGQPHLDKKTSNLPNLPQELKGRWLQDWKKEYRQLPSIVKLILKIKDREGNTEAVTYAFPLPHTCIPITYDQ